jgi:hypothetical protein
MQSLGLAVTVSIAGTAPGTASAAAIWIIRFARGIPNVSVNSGSAARQPGFLQGMTLLLPITLAVIGVSVFTATGHLMQEHFKYLADGDYWVGWLQTMPGIWIVAFSPVAGWLADRFGRRPILITAMFIYAVAGTAGSGSDKAGRKETE